MAKKNDYRKFMQMAVDEMKKSIPEPRKDGKASPKVGVILISEDGKILGSAFRGEMRNGDHAEYTLLDRKFRDKNVTGCYLFATLEPCAPGSRNHPKLGCAERIANARIKKVWVGIEDPDPTVDRKGIKYLQDSGIEVEMFDEGFQDIINKENKEFIKQAKQRREEAKKPKEIQLTPLEDTIENTTIDEFSREALEHYIQLANLKMKFDSPEFIELLEQQQLIQSDSISRNDRNEYRRNDVLPIFSCQGSTYINGTITDKIENKGDSATIQSYREIDDSNSLIKINPGLVERNGQWNIIARSKTEKFDTNIPLYHIDVIFQDKDKRIYRQEFLRNNAQTAPIISEPYLIKASEEKYKPTGLGILLFGKNPRNRYPQAVLKVEARYGKEEPEIHDFSDALVMIPDKVDEWLRRVLSSKINREKFASKTEYSYPIQVLREAIINALVHRDYDIEGAKCYLNIDADKIVVKSPGLPVSPIKFEDFKEFKAPSLSRNPKLLAVFNAMHYAEERGLGMMEMKSLPEKYSLPLPNIIWEAPFINISFPRTQNYFKSIIDSAAFSQLNEEERNGIVFINDKKEVSKTQYANHFGFNDKKAQRHLQRFSELKLVRLAGKGPASKYVFIK